MFAGATALLLPLPGGSSGGGLGGTHQVAEDAWRSSSPAWGWHALARASPWSAPAVALTGLAALFWPAAGLRRTTTTGPTGGTP
ncbi:hypothetical protein [Kineococcus sp. SYSU DK018]|uniref:hypothetical protein n=1 Tax=Kineococcus sp. SYSU DK018 TaxID=3383139 RepID=UPI003D7CC897